MLTVLREDQEAEAQAAEMAQGLQTHGHLVRSVLDQAQAVKMFLQHKAEAQVKAQFMDRQDRADLLEHLMVAAAEAALRVMATAAMAVKE